MSACRRSLVVLALVPLFFTVPTPATAQPVINPTPVSVQDLPDGTGSSVSAVDPAHRIETARSSRPVAPGVKLDSFDWYEAGDSGGWVRADTLSVDLTAGTSLGYLTPGTVTSAEPLSAQAGRAHAVAAINGDFFDINNSNAPEGVGVQNGQLVKSAQDGHQRAVGLDAAGVGRVMEVLFTGTVTMPGRTAPLSQLNSARIGTNGIGVFNPIWGGYSRGRAVDGAPRVTEVVVRHDVVTEVRQSAGADPIPADGFVLAGRENGADTLAALHPGDAVSVSYAARSDRGDAPRLAVGGNQLLIKDGEIVAPPDPLHPRTAVGFSADGKKMFLLTVDGRQAPYLLGLNLRDIAAMLKEMGAANALNLDGGGSSTMLAREPGAPELRVENTPSDGGERPVPNGLALFAPPGSGVTQGFWVRTAADPAAAPGAGTVPGGRPDRVFPGLRRTLIGNAYDETCGPAAPGPQVWYTTPTSAGEVTQDGVFHARAAGAATVTARRGDAHGEIALTVLDPLRRLASTTNRLSLPAPGASGTFGIVGYDRNGYSAPIEPADLALDYDRELIDITPTASGAFAVTAKKPSGATVVVARVGDTLTRVAVTVGVTEQLLASFDDGAKWTFGAARATGSVAPVPDGHTGPGLKLGYDFTQSTGTRTAYAYPPAPITVPGQPLALGIWVYGHGRGEWTAFTVTDAQGQVRSLYGPYITWTGWRYMEVPVPSAMAFPLQVNRFYTIETSASRQYTGEVLIDDMVAKVPPAVDLPPQQKVIDPVVSTHTDVAGRQWRFAVMSDAQFVARDPDSPLVAAARRTLREIKAVHPDFVVINGDFVDEAAPEDLALAHRILNEELGTELPWYYVPGNHEIMGPGKIDNFRREFGTTYRTFDHQGTRFVLLDSSTGTVRGGGFQQAVMLRDALAAARTDGSINSVVVMEHHPPRDPLPAKTSQLSDRLEASMVERWLADFRATGKGAAFIGGHVGVFDASHVDGVPYVINGDSGKAPAAIPADGGFTGWTLVGVDPVQPGAAERSPWLAAEMRPRVDSMRLDAPATVSVGAPAHVGATVQQDTRTFPVAYPVSADWTGSLNLHIGTADGIRPWHIAWLDPATGTLTGLREGNVIIAVTVNGVTRQAEVHIAATAARPAS